MKAKERRFHMIGRFMGAFAPRDGDWSVDQERGDIHLVHMPSSLSVRIWPNTRTWFIWDTASVSESGLDGLACMPPDLFSAAYDRDRPVERPYKGRGWYDTLIDDVVAAAKPHVRNFDVVDTGKALKFEGRY